MVSSAAAVYASSLAPQPLSSKLKREDYERNIPGLELAAKASKAVYHVGERIEITTTLSYHGTADVRIGLTGSLSDPNSKFWYYQFDVKVPFPSWIPLASRAAPTDRGKTLLGSVDDWGSLKRRAGREYKEMFELNELYHMEDPGDYKVSVWRWVYAKDGVGWAIVTSNEITIIVVDPVP